MATEKWIGGSGVGFTWTNAFATADLTSLASGSSVMSSNGTITNQTALDIFCDISFNLASLTTVAPNYLAFYLYPLNQDGSTFGDNQFVAGTQKAATPGATYLKASVIVPVATTTAANGIATGIIMPPGSFLFVVQNNSGVAFSSSTNTIKYRTYNRAVA